MVHPRPQTPQGESVAKPETPLLIILSIACKWGPWQHVQSVIQKAKSVLKTILGRVVKNRNSIPNKSQYITSKDSQHPYRTTIAREGQATTGHPFPHQQTHNYMLRPISRIQTHSYIYIYIYVYSYKLSYDDIHAIYMTACMLAIIPKCVPMLKQYFHWTINLSTMSVRLPLANNLLSLITLFMELLP